MTDKDEQQSPFSYEVFDRQLNTFYMMCQVLMQGWEDYSTQEMNFDIRSLCTKASRLCYMADQDFALQHNDLTHQRKFINQTHIDNISQIVINELFRKGADVVYDKADMLHVSGHACQEELKIIHALTRPKFFIPLHGEQRMLQIHKRVAESMGMHPNNIVVADNGSVIELTTKHIKCETSVPAGEVFVDGSGVGEVGAVVLNDRKLLAEDGMVVIVLPMSSHDHQLLCPPEIVTRGFVYVKESEELLDTLRRIATDTVDGMSAKKRRDDGDVCRTVRSAVSSYLYKTTKRSPMIIPMVTKL